MQKTLKAILFWCQYANKTISYIDSLIFLEEYFKTFYNQ